MSVRMALAKLSPCAAGCALVGGGAVHGGETPAKQTQYVKHVKTAKPRQVVRQAQAPRKVKRVRRVIKRTWSPTLTAIKR